MKSQLDQLRTLRAEYNKLYGQITHIRTELILEYFNSVDIRTAQIIESSTEFWIAYLASEFGEFADKKPVQLVDNYAGFEDRPYVEKLVFLDGSELIIDDFLVAFSDCAEDAIEYLQNKWIYELEKTNGNFQ